QNGCLALVARRAVASRQHIQFGEKGAGVAHISPNGAVGPSHLARVKSKMESYEFGDGLDIVVRVSQGREALARHAGTDSVVVMEGHTLALLISTRLRLTDVVKQRCEARAPKVE